MENEQVNVSLCILIAKFAEESKHYEWLFKHKEVTNFYIWRKLAMMMFLEVEDNEQDQYYMLIDRSKLLVDSFEYIAKLKNMPRTFFVEFKEEQAIGPGVLMAWFLLASQEIFNPNNTLFVACLDDKRSFFPKMTALALAYYLQIRVGFDRVYFLQLDGNGVLLEDIRDVDPFLYRGCKEILNMDADKVDQDVLGLKFVCEVESLGLRREIELYPNGKDTVVDSKNRETYVNLLIQHHYVTSLADQLTYFLEGFSNVITISRLPSFLRCLSLDDFNLMLGRRSDISVEDWKAHIDYHGYEEIDLQIYWFWKVY
ncbi:E3 ubiquitin-protein ligase UPL5-like [Solanum stenotomum]|uniref:E3 ubiquitin-protein ligase UPL5-like n=1 Tax=Solanum stenotomum TaxID=172797 RepID=UPI0020D09500|nr:E3 ubiquitin-protein ligase UPL5-like [Solanum stenotomum]